MSAEALQRYVDFYEQMTPASIARFGEVMTEDARFADPFNDVQGLDKVQAIFEHMFENLTDVRFSVKHAALSGDETALLSWTLNASMGGKPWNVVGMSEIKFAADGRISQHIDHWDAARQFHERLPLVGWLLRAIRKRLQIQ